MLATNTPTRPKRVSRQRGVAAVEFSLLAIVFFTFVFSVCELSRAFYLINTLQEVTRRAASYAATESFDIKKIQQQALFQNKSGNLVLGHPITPDYIRIEFLSLANDGTMSAVSPKPSCPAQNLVNCLADPNAANCIRIVRAQVCDKDSTDKCDQVKYKMLFPLIDLSVLKLPRSTTIIPVQSLGGSTPCS